MKHGLQLAEFSNARVLEKNPAAGPDDMDRYEGFLSASVGEIRKDTPFDVVHEPEGGQEEHCHLELLDVFEAFMSAKAEREGATQEGPFTRKKARAAAVNILIYLFEKNGLYRQPDFEPVALPALA